MHRQHDCFSDPGYDLVMPGRGGTQTAGGAAGIYVAVTCGSCNGAPGLQSAGGGACGGYRQTGAGGGGGGRYLGQS